MRVPAVLGEGKTEEGGEKAEDTGKAAEANRPPRAVVRPGAAASPPTPEAAGSSRAVSLTLYSKPLSMLRQPSVATV